MFSNWFSGDEEECYERSPHKGHIDRLGSRLQELQYASEVIRQHLHEWLRIASHFKRRTRLPAPHAEIVRQYVSERIRGLSPGRSRVLQASVRIFLEADERGRFRRRIDCPPPTPAWFSPILAQYLQFVRSHRGLAQRTAKKYTRQLSVFSQYLEDVGISQLGGITPSHVREFYENGTHNRPRRSYGSTLRVFFRWAAIQNGLPDSLCDAVPRPRQYST